MILSVTSRTPAQMLFHDMRARFPSDDNDLLGKAFEEVAAIYCSLSPEFADSLSQRFETWAGSSSIWEQTGISCADRGIDQVIETQFSNRIAIQMKFRSVGLRFDETNTFISRVSDNRVRDLKIFDKRIFITSQPQAHLTPATLESAAGHDIVYYGQEWFDDINDRLIQAYGSAPVTLEQVLALKGKRPPRVRLTPRPHQAGITSKVIDALDQDDKTTVQAACGIGKSLVGYSLFEHYTASGQVSIIAVPSLALVRQIVDLYVNQQDDEHRHDILAVCSDNDVVASADDDVRMSARERQKMQKNIQEQAHLERNKISTVMYNKEDDIRNWLARGNSSASRVIVSTYQSMTNVVAAMGSVFKAEILMADEAHRLTGAGTFGDSFWKVPTARRVFMTATPKITTVKSGSLKRNDLEIKTVCMDDADKFGNKENWAVYNMAQGIEEGVLSPYSIELLLVPDEKHAQAINDRVYLEKEGNYLLDGREIKCVELFREHCDIDGDNPQVAIAFFNKVENSKKFAEILQAKGIEAVHLDGYMNSRERQNKINRIHRTGGVLCNVNVLSEGVDMPDLSMITFMEPRSSAISIIQALGRPIRRSQKNPDKKGRVVIPIAVDPEVEPEEALQGTEFNALWDVLRAVADHDDTIVRQFYQAQTSSPEVGDKRRGNSTSTESTVTIINTVDKRWVMTPEFLEQFRSVVKTYELRAVLGNRLVDWFAMARAYLKLIRTFNRKPRQHTVEKPIYNWFLSAEKSERGGYLSQEQAIVLNEVRVELARVEQIALDKWFETANTYLEIIKKYNRKPTQKTGERPIYDWFYSAEKSEYRNRLSQEQVIVLNKIRVELARVEQIALDKWFKTANTYLEIIKKYNRKPIRHDATERLICAWFSNAKVSECRNNLRPDQIAMLDEIRAENARIDNLKK